MKITEERKAALNGILLVALMACAAFCIGEWSWVKALSLSPLVVGIILGMIYANTLRGSLPESWSPGIGWCAKKVLRLGIVLYGFRLSFQDVAAVGLAAVVIDAIVVAGTIFIGIFVGRLLKMDRDTALLTACGSAICGAAAVMGVDGTIKPAPYKTAVAVSTVVIFGTLAMFLYPVFYRSGVLELDAAGMSVFTGATVHEVAHVVGAGNAMGPAVSDGAIIVKMLRVMMLVPVLLVLALLRVRKVAAVKAAASAEGIGASAASAGSAAIEGAGIGARVSSSSSSAAGMGGAKITVPWFAVLFLVVIGFNSLGSLPEGVVSFINAFDTFLLTMAMTALGMDTTFGKFRKAGAKPFILAAVLFAWLLVGGVLLVRWLLPLF